MADLRFDGRRVSREWDVVLTAARKAGTGFQLNSGRRTMNEQWALYRAYRNGTGNLAAVPSPNAPHIRVGRIDHALDINSLDGGETRLQQWLEKQGGHPTNPVRGESWHLEMPAADLRRLAARVGGLPTLKRGQTGRSVTRLKRLLYDKGIRQFSGGGSNNRYDPFFGKNTELAVRRFQRDHNLKPDGTVGIATWKALGA